MMSAELLKQATGEHMASVIWHPQQVEIRGTADTALLVRLHTLFRLPQRQKARGRDGSLTVVELEVGSEEHFVACLEHIEHLAIAKVLVSRHDAA